MGTPITGRSQIGSEGHVWAWASLAIPEFGRQGQIPGQDLVKLTD